MGLIRNKDWRIELNFIWQIPRRAIFKYRGQRPQGKIKARGRPVRCRMYNRTDRRRSPLFFKEGAGTTSIVLKGDVLSQTLAGMEE